MSPLCPATSQRQPDLSICKKYLQASKRIEGETFYMKCEGPKCSGRKENKTFEVPTHRLRLEGLHC